MSFSVGAVDASADVVGFVFVVAADNSFVGARVALPELADGFGAGFADVATADAVSEGERPIR
jgi:hypothetical protein